MRESEGGREGRREGGRFCFIFGRIPRIPRSGLRAARLGRAPAGLAGLAAGNGLPRVSLLGLGLGLPISCKPAPGLDEQRRRRVPDRSLCTKAVARPDMPIHVYAGLRAHVRCTCMGTAVHTCTGQRTCRGSYGRHGGSLPSCAHAPIGPAPLPDAPPQSPYMHNGGLPPGRNRRARTLPPAL